MSNYKVLQLTNETIGEVAVNAFMPLGNITRNIGYGSNCRTFSVSTSGADTITINRPGNYKITYNASLVASAAGEINISLLVNGEVIYTSTVTAGAAEDIVNITLPYEIRVCPNCAGNTSNCPKRIQFQLTGIEITSGTSNTIVERVY